LFSEFFFPTYTVPITVVASIALEVEQVKSKEVEQAISLFSFYSL
jgi:hypothetical protein